MLLRDRHAAQLLDTIHGEVLPESLPQRICERIRVSGTHWLWTGQLNNKGYGLLYWERGKRAAHLVVYELVVGKVPRGLELDHLCRIRQCVNPSCMEAVTHKENQRRGGLALTHCRRSSHPRTSDNTYTHPVTGRKSCRACARERDRARTPRRRT